RRAARRLASAAVGDSRGGLPRGVRRPTGVVRAVLRLARAGREPADDPAGGVSAAGRRAGARHGGGGRARAAARRLRGPLRDPLRGGRTAAGRGDVSAVYLLAGRQLGIAGPPRGGEGVVRAA